jgi:hypothetical protein
MRKGLVGGLIAAGLMATFPAVTMAGEPPSSVPGICTAGQDRPAIPIPSDETTGGRAPSVFFGPFSDGNFVGPYLIAPLSVFSRTGACVFTQPPS